MSLNCRINLPLMDSAIISQGVIANSTLSGNIGKSNASITNRFLALFYKRLVFSTQDAAIPCRSILTAISATCLDLNAVLNILIQYPKKGSTEYILLHAPYPDEFVQIDNFWIQTVSSDGISLSGFILWYRPCHRNDVLTWLETLFSTISNFTHSYHPSPITRESGMMKGKVEIPSARMQAPPNYIAANYVPPLYVPSSEHIDSSN